MALDCKSVARRAKRDERFIRVVFRRPPVARPETPVSVTRRRAPCPSHGRVGVHGRCLSLHSPLSRVCRLALRGSLASAITPHAPRPGHAPCHAHRRVRRGGDIRRRSYARLLCVCGTKRSPARTSAVRTCMRGKYGTWALAAPTASASAPTGQVPAARRRRRPGSPPSGSSASAPTEQVPAPVSPPSGARRGRRPWRPGRMSAASAARAPRGAAARRAPWPRGSLCRVSCNATRTFKGEYASCQRVGRPSSPRGVCQSCVWRDQIARAAHESPTAHAI